MSSLVPFLRLPWHRVLQCSGHSVLRGRDATASYSIHPHVRHSSSKRGKGTYEEVRHVDFFSGIGMFTLAVRRTFEEGYRCMGAYELEKIAADVYHENFPDHDVHVGDVLDVSLAKTPLCAPYAFTLWTLGFPCTLFSNAGTQDKHHPGRKLVFNILERLESLRDRKYSLPDVLLAENVPEFMKTQEFVDLQESLSALNYNFSFRVYNASQFGVPQHRTRVFMVAVKRTLSNKPFEFPDEPNSMEEAKKLRLRDVLEDPQRRSSTPLHGKTSSLLYSGAKPLQWRPRCKEAVENGTPLDALRNSSTLMIKLGHYGDENGRTYQGNLIHSDLGHAGTVCTNGTSHYLTPAPLMSEAERGALISQGHIHVYNGQDYVIRRLTPRECARLQGYPDDLAVGKCKKRELIHVGNGVPVPIVEWIAKAIKDQYVGDLKPASKKTKAKTPGGQGGKLIAVPKPKFALEQLKKTMVVDDKAELVEVEIKRFTNKVSKDFELSVESLAKSLRKIFISK